jgi:flagellar biosynthesis repressor protein FlbT
MPLRISLKPGERLIVGGAVVRNAGSRASLLIENDVPILRGREVMSVQEATSPCRRIYFTIQLMYVDERNLAEHRRLFLDQVREAGDACPGTAERLAAIAARVTAGQFYQALKLTRQLVVLEEELLGQAPRGWAADDPGGGGP